MYAHEASCLSKSYLTRLYLNAGLAVKSQTLHSKPFFLLGDVPFGVWPGPFFFIFWSVVSFSYFGVW